MKALTNEELIDARVSFLKNGAAYYEAKRIYSRGDGGLHRFAAVCGYGQRDPKESFTLYEKYPGRMFYLRTFEEVLAVVADVLAWKYERENRDVEMKVGGVRVQIEEGAFVPSDEYDADVRRVFSKLVETAATVSPDAPVWTSFTFDELPNVRFTKTRDIVDKLSRREL